MRRGRIEVFMSQYAKTVGYLAFYHQGAAPNYSIVQKLGQAQVISFPTVPPNARFHIKMEGYQVPAQYPYLGLAVKNTDWGIVPHIIPEALPLPAPYQDSRHKVKPSAYCLQNSAKSPGYAPIATWIFAACSESTSVPRFRKSAKTSHDPLMRASSAVWRFDESTTKLSMMWTMDNDSEEELKAVLWDDTRARGTGTLHIHRRRDGTPAQSVLDESPVDLIFIPEESE